jgi:hypothetical protein
MKTIEEIKGIKRCTWGMEAKDGLRGVIFMPSRWEGSIIVSNGAGWEHVSVAPRKKHIMPSWEDMCFVKNLFWNEDEAVIQIHPEKSEYVSNVPNCLHLWRCSYKEMVLPPKILVGINERLSAAEIEEEIKAAYELAGEKYER